MWYNLLMKLTEEIKITAPVVKIGGDAIKVEEQSSEASSDNSQPQ